DDEEISVSVGVLDAELAQDSAEPVVKALPALTLAGLTWRHHPIVCPVFFQSARNAVMPASVSGCLTSAFRMAGGTVATSAPIMAASLTWFTVRIEAARMSVERS